MIIRNVSLAAVHWIESSKLIDEGLWSLYVAIDCLKIILSAFGWNLISFDGQLQDEF